MIMFILGALGGWAGSHFTGLALALAFPLGLWIKSSLTWKGFLWAAAGLLVGTLVTPMTMFIGGVSHNDFFTVLVLVNALGTPLLWLIGGVVSVNRQRQKRQLRDPHGSNP